MNLIDQARMKRHLKKGRCGATRIWNISNLPRWKRHINGTRAWCFDATGRCETGGGGLHFDPAVGNWNGATEEYSLVEDKLTLVGGRES